mmetsp:Transcript_17351/g.49596  ORF Transcript_17351/g.49596 Transcript_17351/m.49596 type:complete len:286 (-) Transcript_17351:1057-1914(-)
MELGGLKLRKRKEIGEERIGSPPTFVKRSRDKKERAAARMGMPSMCRVSVSAGSHGLVGRAAATLRHRPVDVLVRHLDRAALAVHAVLRVDDQLLLAGRVVVHVLIHLGGAETLLRPGVLVDRLLGLVRQLRLDLEVRRLVALVVGPRARQVGQDVKADLAVRLGIVDRLELGRRLGRVAVARLAVLGERPRLHAAENKAGDARVQHARVQAVLEGRRVVAHALKLLVHPRVLELRLIRGDLLGLALNRVLERVVHRFGGHHRGLHRGVAALDLGHVQETGRAAH